MKLIFAMVAVFAIWLPAYASIPVPEIDGSLAIQFAALAGGLALLLKKKH